VTSPSIKDWIGIAQTGWHWSRTPPNLFVLHNKFSLFSCSSLNSVGALFSNFCCDLLFPLKFLLDVVTQRRSPCIIIYPNPPAFRSFFNFPVSHHYFLPETSRHASPSQLVSYCTTGGINSSPVNFSPVRLLLRSCTWVFF
jgi:hypothetical protein